MNCTIEWDKAGADPPPPTLLWYFYHLSDTKILAPKESHVTIQSEVFEIHQIALKYASAYFGYTVKNF